MPSSCYGSIIVYTKESYVENNFFYVILRILLWKINMSSLLTSPCTNIIQASVPKLWLQGQSFVILFYLHYTDINYMNKCTNKKRKQTKKYNVPTTRFWDKHLIVWLYRLEKSDYIAKV